MLTPRQDVISKYKSGWLQHYKPNISGSLLQNLQLVELAIGKHIAISLGLQIVKATPVDPITSALLVASFNASMTRGASVQATPVAFVKSQAECR